MAAYIVNTHQTTVSTEIPFMDGHSRQAPLPDVSIVIVNFESGDHLRACIASLEQGLGQALAEVVVVDNGSSDDSVAGIEDLDWVEVVRNPGNPGYGAACNLAAKLTKADWIWFLNPDTVFHPNSLGDLAKAAESLDQGGVFGPRILNPDGSLQPSCRVVPDWKIAVAHALLGVVYPSNRFTRQYLMQDLNRDVVQEVDWVSGAAMLVRREAFEQIGGFDERYFMYVEDLDLCDRIRSAGWKIYYHPVSTVVHHIAGSTRRAPYLMIAHHHKSALRYAWIRSRGTPRVLLVPLVAAGLAARLILSYFDFYIKDRRARGTVHGV